MYDFKTMDKRYLIFGNLFLVSNRLQTTMDSKIPEITAKQWFVLMMLGMFDEAPTLKQLAAMGDSSHQNIKQIALKLESKGFLKLVPDTKDRRALRIFTTKEFERWEKENQKGSHQFVENMFVGLSLEETTILSDLLFKIYNNLGEMQNEK